MATPLQSPELAAQDLLERSWGDVIPVDPVKIARYLGIQAFEAQLDSGVAGVLVKRPGREPTIIMNNLDSPKRQRFTCAHELGHFVARSNDSAEDQENYESIDLRDALASTGLDPSEVWANQFGAALLMPAARVQERFDMGLTSVEMALEFDVSPDAMQFRMTNLQLVQ